MEGNFESRLRELNPPKVLSAYAAVPVLEKYGFIRFKNQNEGAAVNQPLNFPNMIYAVFVSTLISAAAEGEISKSYLRILFPQVYLRDLYFLAVERRAPLLPLLSSTAFFMVKNA